MAVKKGYKQTEVGVIPEDWEIHRLQKLGEALIGLTYSPFDVCSAGTLVLRSSNIQESRLVFDNNVYVNCLVPSKILVEPGDVLICVRNGSRDLIGKTAFLDDRVRGMTFGAFMAVFRSPVNRFLIHQFRAICFLRQVREHLGATINQITNRSLNSFLIPVPPTLAEQEAIAGALSDADAWIESLEQLIAKKRQIKQGAMQELLTGKRRLPGFSGKWETKRLGDIGSFLKGSGVRKNEANSGDIPCVRYGEIYTHHNDYIRRFNSSISRAVAETATRLNYGDLLFAGSGETKAEIGKCVAYSQDTEAYAGGDIVILRSSKIDPVFMGYYCNTRSIAEQKAARGQGDAVVHISSSALAGVQICVPDLHEQAAIATLLSEMDTEIESLESKLAKAREIKQGMMQELLTGRIRLV